MRLKCWMVISATLKSRREKTGERIEERGNRREERAKREEGRGMEVRQLSEFLSSLFSFLYSIMINLASLRLCVRKSAWVCGKEIEDYEEFLCGIY